MLRKFAFIHINLILCVLCIGFLAFQSYATPRKTEMVVVIDPGHGGEQPGALGRSSKEKDIVLKVAKKVGEILVKNHSDIEIVYTRTKDTTITLHDRGSLANMLNADLFISIHADADEKKLAQGSSVYVMGLDKAEQNMDVAMMENAEIMYEEGYETKYEGFNPNSPESYIIFNLVQNMYLEQSLYFSSLVEQELTMRTKHKSRGVKQGPFLVLWRTNMPSVLIEIGFISHYEEEKYIASEKGQNEIAQAIAAAIGEYKKRWNKNNNGGAAQTSATTTSPKPNNNATVKPSLPPIVKQPVVNRTTYHVQIFSTSRLLKENAREFKGLKGVECYRSGTSYRYYVGTYSTEKDAAKHLREVRAKFPDAFIVKLLNGKP